MKRILILGTVMAAVLVAGSSAASAADPVPFPSATTDPGGLFVAAQTVTAGGAMTNYFAPGDTVVFRAYAVINKAKRLVTADDMKYFYITIPNQPHVKLTYNPSAAGATKGMPWVGTWTIPASYAAGNVPFKVHLKLRGRQTGSFTQTPVEPSMLTVSAAPPPVFTPAPTGDTGLADSSNAVDLSIYADSVAGSHPTGAAPRQEGCSQTNVYKRGEQAVIRVWGMDLASGAVLSTDNVDTATVSIAGQPDLTLNWGAHGSTGAKHYFWTAPWNVPADTPLGDTIAHISFKTIDGKTATFDYALNIIP